jgi:hypothetical protein
MSYDVEVFSIEKPLAAASEEGRGWQIAVDGPLNVEPEDIPAQVRTLLPGLRFLTQFYLEGNASSAAQKKLLSMARGLARSARGVVVDQQQGIVETPRGLDEGIYYTFLGASFDLPASERDVFTAMAGIQKFTGKNERLHLRGSYLRVIAPKIGLSAQLRARYFHSTAPGEFDD